MWERQRQWCQPQPGAQRQRQRRGHLAGCSTNSVGGMHLESAFAEEVV